MYDEKMTEKKDLLFLAAILYQVHVRKSKKDAYQFLFSRIYTETNTRFTHLKGAVM